MRDLIKDGKQIEVMKAGGERLSAILESTLKKIKPGLSTGEIDLWIDQEIVASGGEASFKKVAGYHHASCVGVNDEVVHSLPSFEKIIKEGDLLKIDLGLCWQGLNTDLSWTVIVQSSKACPELAEGCKVQSYQEKFLNAGKKALDEAIKVALPGRYVGDISREIQKWIERAGFTPVKVLTGHGIGSKLHESPYVPCFLKGRVEDTAKLVPGMTLAIEVIYNLGGAEVVLENDGWTISTEDGKISGLFEKTIAVTENGPLILTPAVDGRT